MPKKAWKTSASLPGRSAEDPAVARASWHSEDEGAERAVRRSTRRGRASARSRSPASRRTRPHCGRPLSPPPGAPLAQPPREQGRADTSSGAADRERADASCTPGPRAIAARQQRASVEVLAALDVGDGRSVDARRRAARGDAQRPRSTISACRPRPTRRRRTSRPPSAAPRRTRACAASVVLERVEDALCSSWIPSQAAPCPPPPPADVAAEPPLSWAQLSTKSTICVRSRSSSAPSSGRRAAPLPPPSRRLAPNSKASASSCALDAPRCRPRRSDSDMARVGASLERRARKARRAARSRRRVSSKKLLAMRELRASSKSRQKRAGSGSNTSGRAVSPSRASCLPRPRSPAAVRHVVGGRAPGRRCRQAATS